MQEERKEPRLVVSIERPYGGDYLHVQGRFVWHDPEDGKLRNFDAGGSWPGQQDWELADLVIHAQGDLTPHEGLDAGRDSLYAYSISYRDVYSINLQRAEAMHSLLRKVERGLKKVESTFGYIHSYGEYMVRVGNVLGIREFGFRVDDSDHRFHGTLADYRWVEPAMFEGVLHYELTKFRERCGVTV